MQNKQRILIDSTHDEETRVVVVDENNIVQDFDFEMSDKLLKIGHIYLAKVTRVEQGLQAAFVDYGGQRHGFLPFSEIHPDYYQIPKSDREEDALDEADITLESEKIDDTSDNSGIGVPDEETEKVEEESCDSDEDVTSDSAVEASREDEIADEKDSDENTVFTEIEAEIEAERKKNARILQDLIAQYKIQEVIRKRQILLVQVIKEERGNKGVSMTTYLSLPGRYCVLMPNSGRGSGISRKISDARNRRRLREIIKDLEIPEGMGLVIRTAGASKTKLDIKRDFEYLLRQWSAIREKTLSTIAPNLVYEDGSLIQRSIRDLYNKDISEILVDGEKGYREAKDFMKMLAPSHARHIKLCKNPPLFPQYGVEKQLEQLFDNNVPLKSGGYLVIGQTEALTTVDVNSGRSTKEKSVESTAVKTNIEAAEEVARQLRLRDIAGLIVIDFIDMEEQHNIRSVEKACRESLKNERARIQVGKISSFGLLEMSRQRLRPSVLETISGVCTRCMGTGVVRSDESLVLAILRRIEASLHGMESKIIRVVMPVSILNYLINYKRAYISLLEERFSVKIFCGASVDLQVPNYTLDILDSDAETNIFRQVENTDLAHNPKKRVVCTDESSSKEDDKEADKKEKASGKRKRRRKRKQKKENVDEKECLVESEDSTAVGLEADENVEVSNMEQQSHTPNNEEDKHVKGTTDERKPIKRRGRTSSARRGRQISGGMNMVEEANSEESTPSTDVVTDDSVQGEVNDYNVVPEDQEMRQTSQSSTYDSVAVVDGDKNKHDDNKEGSASPRTRRRGRWWSLSRKKDKI